MTSLSRLKKILVILGPSGVGKTTVIQALKNFDTRFQDVWQYTTRPLRKGEVGKIHISEEAFDELVKEGQLVSTCRLYQSYKAGILKSNIEQVLDDGKFPVFDWGICSLNALTESFSKRLYVVYIEPPSIGVWCERLLKDSRDFQGIRRSAGETELGQLWSGVFDDVIDYRAINKTAQVIQVAKEISLKYIDAQGF